MYKSPQYSIILNRCSAFRGTTLPYSNLINISNPTHQNASREPPQQPQDSPRGGRGGYRGGRGRGNRGRGGRGRGAY